MKRDITDGALRSEESRPPSNKVVGFREQFQSLHGEIVLSINCLELNACHSSRRRERTWRNNRKALGGNSWDFRGTVRCKPLCSAFVIAVHACPREQFWGRLTCIVCWSAKLHGGLLYSKSDLRGEIKSPYFSLSIHTMQCFLTVCWILSLHCSAIQSHSPAFNLSVYCNASFRHIPEETS